MSNPLTYQMVQFTNSVANFNNMQPGQQFTGTWTLRNTSGEVWPGNLQIVYVETNTSDTETAVAHPMGAPATITLQEMTGRPEIHPGTTVQIRFNLVAPTQAGAYAFHWQIQQNGQARSHTHWLRIGVVASVVAPVVAPTPRTTPAADTVQFGMNVNPNPGGHPLDVDRLTGLNWVRYVFWASREGITPEEAYQQRYRHIIQSYASAGIGSLIILHQDTFWGNGPWDNGGWADYAAAFGRECGRVARMCAEFGDKVAYQIYNEQDSGFGSDAGNPNPSAIGIAPANYAQVLDKAVAGIRAAHPGAKIVFGGLKTGPNDAIPYAQQVQQALGGSLPVDAMAYHPYGRFVTTPFFNFGSIGRLGDALNQFKNAFPNLPLWITEVGVAADSHIGPEHYQSIATYMREVTEELATNFNDYVAALIWFGWTDLMRNAGVNTIDNQPKAHIYAAFEAMKNQERPSTPPPPPPPDAEEPAVPRPDAQFLSFATSLTNHNAVPTGSTFTSQWTFKNSGNTNWDERYSFVYLPTGPNPAPMTGQTRYQLTEVADFTRLRPGQTTTIKLDMTAPAAAGRTYRSQWELRDPQDKRLGFVFQEITTIPAPTAGTGVRAADMVFVADHTIADNTRLVAGTDFDKQWLVRNTGSRHWGDGFRLNYIEGDLPMARGLVSHQVPNAKPGETVTLTIPMTAPPARNGQPTVYKTLWRMQDDRNDWFGDALWVTIVSTTAVSVTPGHNTALDRLLNDSSLWYSQLDSAWSGDKLGFGEETIGSWGCLLTCMAMGLSAFGTRIDPKEMNQRVRNQGNQAIVGSAIQFAAPQLIAGLQHKGNLRSWENSRIEHSIWTGRDPIERIDTELAAGNIVLAQVDNEPNTSNHVQHWVVLVKRTPDGSDYLMIDPLTPANQTNTQPRSMMAKYGRPNPSRSHAENLRNAIKSSLVYHKPA